jgi:hypothetical protein
MRNIIFCSLFLIYYTSSMAQGLAPYQVCNTIAPFVVANNIASANCAFSTTQVGYKGVVLLDINTNKIYQDSTWHKYGNMGPLALDALGNVYVAPVPMVNVLDNKREQQNRIYTINAQTGKMNLLLELDKDTNGTKANPYGVVGLFYDCNSKLLYATSIYGSTASKQLGKIYCINPITKKILWRVVGIDAMGIAIGNFNKKPTLFVGSLKSNSIISYTLTPKGINAASKKTILSLVNLGPRGDDKPKKIRITIKGELLITAFPFYYNLTAPTDKQETIYTYNYNTTTQKWTLVNQEDKGIPIGFE